jgi:hypothetical protein
MMKPLLPSLLASLFVFSALAEDQTKIIQKVSNEGAENSSVLVETTKNGKFRNDYEVVSGEEEISGDPTAGTKEAYASWKEACREWKKELKENNKDGQVLVSSCGTAKFTKDESAGAGSGIYTYRSEGKYKVKTRLRDR